MKWRKHYDPERTSPGGIMGYAIDFFAAADAVDERFGGDRPAVPVLFLAARSIELGLKAFLLLKTDYFPPDHHLLRLLKKAGKVGLNPEVMQDAQPAIELLNSLYTNEHDRARVL